MIDLTLEAHAARLCQAAGVGLVLARALAELGLESLNQRQVRHHAVRIPEAFAGTIDEPTYARSVQYTLAKSRFNQVTSVSSTFVLLIALLSGLLPWVYDRWVATLGAGPWAMGAFLVVVGLGFALSDLPFDWHAQFHLEARFGFNTTTPRMWWLDRLKGMVLAVALGYPLLVLILKLVEWAGDAWWWWAWGAVIGFQWLLTLLAPVLILPLFNTFTPLPAGALRDRLLALADRTQFRARSIQVMDGSKRSRHSNAFFTGFGRFRKIVLFDTLIQQLSEAELAAVLAHEIGHYRKRHILKLMAWSVVSLLAAFWAIAWLARQDWFLRAFGFEPGSLALTLLLFGLLGGAVTFWFSPLGHLWSRRFEYEADAFAATAMAEVESLIGALRRLNEQNLSNLTPHPLYSGFHYSHPTLLERETALRRRAPSS